MRSTRPIRHAPLPMDVLRPAQVFGRPSTAATHDARRWLRLVMVTLASAATLAVLLGAA